MSLAEPGWCERAGNPSQAEQACGTLPVKTTILPPAVSRPRQQVVVSVNTDLAQRGFVLAIAFHMDISRCTEEVLNILHTSCQDKQPASG